MIDQNRCKECGTPIIICGEATCENDADLSEKQRIIKAAILDLIELIQNELENPTGTRKELLEVIEVRLQDIKAKL